MTDDAALTAAAAAAPDDDLPRLVFADWLDDRGEAGRAEFVRAQVRLAAADPWEPFAAFCRHRRPDWVRGDLWWNTLPKVDGYGIEWHPDRAFRRGFGWAVIVRDVRWLLEDGPRLFAEAPVGELHLPTATYDEWKAFGRASWLPRVKAIHFYSTTTPVEPIRELIASPFATGIEEIVFGTASGAGMPDLLEDLFASPLGKRLKRLDLRVGPIDSGPLFDALWWISESARLNHLALTTFSPPDRFDRMSSLYRSHPVQRLESLELANIPSADPPWTDADLPLPCLKRFRASACGGIPDRDTHGRAESLISLDLSDFPFDWRSAARRSQRAFVDGLPNLRSLTLRRSQFRNPMIRPWLTEAPFWSNLVELDLRDNRLTDAGAEHLLAAPVPADLTALLLAGNQISDGTSDRLRRHFGERVILSGSGG